MSYLINNFKKYLHVSINFYAEMSVHKTKEFVNKPVEAKHKSYSRLQSKQVDMISEDGSEYKEELKQVLSSHEMQT